MHILKVSPLSGPFTADEITLEVTIYQDDVHGETWTLKVVAPDGTQTYFGQGFATDSAAHRALQEDIATGGTQSYLKPKPIIYRD